MTTWNWTTISSLATAGGTLVLGVATFAAVRSANRAARIAERAFEIGLRPILAPSRIEDPIQRVMFADRHWVDLEGGKAVVESVDGVVYLAMLVRNVGNGMAVIEAWEPFAGQKKMANDGWGALEDFRPQTRTLWVAPGDVAFWQGALRDENDELQQAVTSAVADGALTIDLLYLDHEGGQRTLSRFSLIRRDDVEAGDVDDHADGDEDEDEDEGRGGRQEWWVSLTRHHVLAG